MSKISIIKYTLAKKLFLKNNRLSKLLKYSIATTIYATSSYAVYGKVNLDNEQNKNWQCATIDKKWSCFEVGTQYSSIFNNYNDSSAKQLDVAKALGWNFSDNLIGGLYTLEKPLHAISNKTKISFDESTIAKNGNVEISGSVEISDTDQTLLADNTNIFVNPKTKKVESATLHGNISVQRENELFISNYAEINLKNDFSYLEDSYFLIGLDRKDTFNYSVPDRFTGYGFGKASEIFQISKNEFHLKDITYTAAAPTNEVWKLSATSMNFDKQAGWAEVFNPIFYVYDVPVMYFPYMTFAINAERTTGLLFPEVGFNTNSGYFYSQPIYLNLAPNIDATFTPTYYNHRGLLLSLDSNYITEQHSGELGISFNRNDRIGFIDAHGDFANKNRGSFLFSDHGSYQNNIQSDLIYNYISDPEFNQDFSNGGIFSVNQTVAERSASLSYADDLWDINSKVLDYQLIDENLNLINRPYATLPQININFNNSILQPSGFPFNFEYGFDNQSTYFYKSDFKNQHVVNAQRYYVKPKISLPFIKQWGSFKPSLEIDQTFYALNNNKNTVVANNFNDSSINRTLPIANIDTSLNFIRNFQNFDVNYSQNLTPRLFYTYIPYQNQSNIPNFDSSYTTFTYDSLFVKNRFNGIDRVNNANQISYSLETNINNDDTGENIFRAGIGQMLYFDDRKVSLCRGEACIIHEQPFSTQKLSNIAAFFNLQLINHVSFNVNNSYNQQANKFEVQNYILQYMYDPRHILNIGYTNITNNYSLLTPEQIENGDAPPSNAQITASSLWEITDSIAAIGMINFSTDQSQLVDSYLGFEYDQGTWVFRTIWQRYLKTTLDANNPASLNGTLDTRYTVEFEIKGLGSSDNSSLQEQVKLIPGYSETESGFN